ncbi:MAG: hypothetical protein V1815_00985 [Candidatus Woesearchaeota archaeon]
MRKFIFLYLFLLIFLIGCSNKLPQQVMETNLTNIITENKTIENNTISNIIENIKNITEEISNQSDETELPENTYKLYVNNKTIVNYKTIILQNINNEGHVTISVDNVTWTIYQTKFSDIINGLEIQTLEINFKDNYAILEIKPFILKKDRYIVYKGQIFKVNNITNITFKDINSDDSIFLEILSGRNLIGRYDIKEGDSITTNNITITNIKAYPRELGYESYAIIRIVKD